jgi:hypothetical protein
MVDLTGLPGSSCRGDHGRFSFLPIVYRRSRYHANLDERVDFYRSAAWNAVARLSHLSSAGVGIESGIRIGKFADLTMSAGYRRLDVSIICKDWEYLITGSAGPVNVIPACCGKTGFRFLLDWDRIEAIHIRKAGFDYFGMIFRWQEKKWNSCNFH